MIEKESIKKVIEDLLEGRAHFLVDVQVQPGNKILVYIDGDHDITITDCREISRQIEERLDRDREDFELTVSSAGIDRPLTQLRQYRKNMGRNLTVKTTEGSSLSGKLVRADETGIELEVVKKKKETELITLSYKEIKKAKVEVSFGKK
jgi:ribosome maturation factor RimP